MFFTEKIKYDCRICKRDKKLKKHLKLTNNSNQKERNLVEILTKIKQIQPVIQKARLNNLLFCYFSIETIKYFGLLD